tara:strand:+ start:965 stop:1180 length:216 start_codon:yes stop_codon:yes gene_type:complete
MSGPFYTAMLALVPLALSPAASEAESDSITAQLCSGATIEIPIKRKKEPAPSCPGKACHAGNCRRKFDLAQ